MTLDKGNIALRSMEEELKIMEDVGDKATATRNKVRTILDDAVSKISFSEDDVRDPKVTLAMLSVLDKAVATAEKEENASFKRVSAKAKLKEIKSSEEQSEATIGLIKAITQNDTSKDVVLPAAPDEIELNLDPDMEPISETELRLDPDDLTDIGSTN